MLVLTFREGEPCYIGDDIKVHISIDALTRQVELIIEAPEGVLDTIDPSSGAEKDYRYSIR